MLKKHFKLLPVTALLLCFTINAGQKEKAPFKVLFSNDFTNSSQITPYHSAKEPWSTKVLNGQIDETVGTGIDAHLIQPAHTWVPWWQSKTYPMEKHYTWWQKKYGNLPKTTIHEYIINGGDPMADFIKHCKEENMPAFISLRLNDGHHLPNVMVPNNRTGPHAICKFYGENPKYRIDPKKNIWVQNWAYSPVRIYKLKLIEEICQYNIDGIELDFMRMPAYFKEGQIDEKQKAKIMSGFVYKARKLLDKYNPSEKQRWLSVRIPNNPEKRKETGIDVRLFRLAGVDMFVLSPSFYTQQQVPVQEVRDTVGDAAVYLEVCHVIERTAYRKDPEFKRKVGHSFSDLVRIDRYTTDQQYYTAAHLAYNQGADGISAFNFVYYRQIAMEPPFHVFKNIGDKDWVAAQPQHYIMTNGYQPGAIKHLPKDLGSQKPLVFTWFMSPVKGGWTQNGILRIKTLPRTDFNGTQLTASINGIALKETMDISEPYESPYPIDEKLLLSILLPLKYL